MTQRQAATELCPVMLFSGKGGVGKTTLAAATAVHLSRAGSRVLLLSTDPAHNLSDVLDQRLSSRPMEVLPGLDAMEVDARGMFGEMAASVDSSGLGGLVKMVSETPGIDEFGAIEVLLQVLERAEHEVVIVDTAPTGHTLRLLMVPQLLEGWFGTLLSLRHRISKAGRLVKRLFRAELPKDGDLEQGLTGGRDRINHLRSQLSDPAQTQIILVTIPETMSVLETARTVRMLAGHGMPVATVVVNQIQPDNEGCLHCSRRRAIHLGELEHLRQLAGDVPVRLLDSQPWEIRGCEPLGRLGRVLWSPATCTPAIISEDR